VIHDRLLVGVVVEDHELKQPAGSICADDTDRTAGLPQLGLLLDSGAELGYPAPAIIVPGTVVFLRWFTAASREVALDRSFIRRGDEGRSATCSG